ncbi:CapA family protein [Paracoccus aminophilus]|uniref:Cyanophycin synthetase n=1 Tax=Paracoccus aminophilus JCM 7686 TaxID=1367847 RepID=S5XXR0_PARAH|nr:CapA family protein [Paracoccus aminophilus]AGT08235.1 cyanophycin synthetase [Paracoccus aminophilus JCM 7686]
MKMTTSAVYLPGNIYTRRLALELSLEGAAGVELPPQRLRDVAKAFGFIRHSVLDFPAWRRVTRAKEPVPVAALVELLAVLVQRYAYWPVKFCGWRAQPEDLSAPTAAAKGAQAKGYAIFEISSEGPGREAARVALTLAEAVVEGRDGAALEELFLSEMAGFLKKTLRETPSADALLIARAAQARGIPWSVLSRSQYLRLGIGRDSHTLYGTESTNTTSIARAISRDKALSNDLLRRAGLPAARQRTARTEDEAVAHARTLGFPLVVKPLTGNMGQGVTVGASDEAQILRAFHRAREVSRDVVLETMIEGDETRLLVVNGRMISAVRRHPAQVRGDGTSTVRALVEASNRQPEREQVLTGRMAVMKPIQLDGEALELLAAQKLTLEAVPQGGQVVLLRQESNISRGGHPEDVTRLVHPSIRRVAERAAAAVGLDVCGVDFITTDLSAHWNTTGGAICEVNSRPGINMHLFVSGKGAGRITDAFLDMLFPDDSRPRLPVVALLGEPEETLPLRRAIEATAARANRPLAVVTTEERRTTVLSSSRWAATAAGLIWDDLAEAAVIEITPKQLVRDGLGFDRVDLAVLPPKSVTATQELAAQVLRHLAGPRVVIRGEAEAPAQALAALGLPVTALDDQLVQGPSANPAAAPRHETSADEFTALFVGDVGFGESYMHHPRVAGLQQLLSTQGHGYSLAGLQGLLGGADLTVANLEVPLAGRPDLALQGRKKYLGWSDPSRSLAALRDAGIDAVTLANNHALDCGTEGLSETLLRLREGGIASFGAGADAEAAGLPFIHRFTVGGVERSLVVYGGFETRARYEERYRWYADRGFAGVSKIDPDRIARSVAALRQVLPNPLFIAFPHWGTDYEPITAGQRETAAALAKAGLDLVIGHGAHFSQGAEIVEACPVLFNIGNFVWNTPGRFNKRDVAPYGTAVALIFRRGQRGGPTLRLYPLMVDNAQTNFQNRPVTPEEFPAAAQVITAGWPGRPRRLRNADAPYLEMKLPLREGAQPAAATASARARPTKRKTATSVAPRPNGGEQPHL